MERILGKFGFWTGINLIILAVLIFVFPDIVAYAIAAMLLAGGISLVALSRKSKQHRQARNSEQGDSYIYYKEY